MLKTVLRSVVFAAAVVAVSLAVDLLLAVFYQGTPLQDRSKQFFIFRAALHGATFLLTAAGAAVGFAFLRSYSITHARFWAITVWLIAGSALVAFFGGKVLGSREAHPEG
jgi:hypothetical protein